MAAMAKRRKRAICSSHCFFWRWHHVVAAFFVFVTFGFVSSFVILSSPKAQTAIASTSENVYGWAWADPIGWISLNDLNPNSGGGTYGMNIDVMTGQVNGFGWSEHVGWVCFGNSCNVGACNGVVPSSNPPYNTPYADVSPAPVQPGSPIRNLHGWAKVCSLGDAGWISLNCADTSPSSCGSYAYRVPLDLSTLALTDASPPGSPGNGTSFAWNGNDDQSGLGYIDFRNAYLHPQPEQSDAQCSNGMDDDLNGLIDCNDAGCAAAPNCVPPPPALTEDQCPLGTTNLCCSDNVDNEGNGLTDCADLACQANAPICAVAWLQTKYGDVYAQKGIAAIAAPAQQFNASYCLSVTDGTISGFASQSACTVTNASLSLPKSSTSYRGTLGSLDIRGILAGRYGSVVNIADGSGIPTILGGKVYVYNGGGTLTLPAVAFSNGAGSGARGNGLLLVNGADLRITGDVTYSSALIDTTLRNLASFGVIVTQVNGVGGSMYVDPTVTQISGAYFAEDTIHTGVSVNPLQVFGMLAARAFSFDRTSGNSQTPSEGVTFDGRALANPPPGMQDIGKSLPTTKDAF